MKKLFLAVFVIALASAAAPAFAQVDFGVRAGYYTDVQEGFVGVEAITPIARSWFFNPNVEWVLMDGGDYFTINGDVHYDFRTGSPTMIWAGAGLAVGYDNTGVDAETDLGFNLIAGIGRRVETLIPYGQLKYTTAGDGNDFVIAGGLRF